METLLIQFLNVGKIKLPKESFNQTYCEAPKLTAAGECCLLLHSIAHICLSWIVPGTLLSSQLGLTMPPWSPTVPFFLLPLGVASEFLVMDPVFIVQRKTSAGMIKK